MIKIKELDKDLIHLANSNSFNGTRGDNSNYSYKSYIDKVLSWDILNEKKQELCDRVHKKYSEILRYEAQHVSVMVAGPAMYNSKKLDKSDQILQKSKEFCDWFDKLEDHVKNSKVNKANDNVDFILRQMESLKKYEWYSPGTDLYKLSNIDSKVFIEKYLEFDKDWHFRKNTKIYKRYIEAKNGNIVKVEREVFFKDSNLTAYIFGDRVFIKLITKPKRQLIVALKSRKWWWNAYEKAWSTYINKLDKEWIKSISERYKEYL